jgi:hypothetical protein
MTTTTGSTRACPGCGAPLVDDPTRQATVGNGLVPIMVCPTDGAFWWNRWGPAAMAEERLIPTPA